MTSLTALASEEDNLPASPGPELLAGSPACYSITIFTQQWKEVRDFYVDLLQAKVLSERADRYTEMEVGGLPLTIRRSDHGEIVTYMHLYISMKSHEVVLKELRRRGIIVTNVGPYSNFRDPEGRVIKLSEAKMVVS